MRLTEAGLTTGIEELDAMIGGVRTGDNIVWEVDSGAPVDRFMRAFINSSIESGCPVVYVNFNRSPQTIAGMYCGEDDGEAFTLVDCFSAGKGNSDETFLEFFENRGGQGGCKAVLVEDPSSPPALQDMVGVIDKESGENARYVFDSLTGMFDLWGDEDVVLRFFGHICPRLFDKHAIAYWLLETAAHSERFLAKVRHITQVVLDMAVNRGVRTLTLKRSANRRSADIGMPQKFDLEADRIRIFVDSREGRELTLLTQMGNALENALEPAAFFERTMEILADELGMARGTLVLLDRASGTLRIAAAHGLSRKEMAKGEYAVGEGITGRVVETGLAEVVPDISRDSRFLDRTASRGREDARSLAFICVPVKMDGETLGALSVDRPFALEHTLEKDLRLLTIVSSLVAQVLKINRIVRMDKDEILARDESLLEELKSRYQLGNVIGQSKAMRDVLASATQAARSRVSVLVSGETGTGKELVANVIHYNSSRATGPFIKVNCGALPETLLDSELFGHVKGAFTGAVRDRKGRFKLAGGGTLFLDEVGEMSPRLQMKLLRVLQEGEYEPVGSEQTVRMDVRVVAATNKDLKEEMRRGRFREDLYYRLNVVPIVLPPLRERREDIPLLVKHFLDKYNEAYGRNVSKMSRQVLDLMLDYDWPGNVRELENCVERAVAMSASESFSPDLLPEEVHSTTGRKRGTQRGYSTREVEDAVRSFIASSEDPGETRDFLSALVEESVIRNALDAGMSQRELAKRLDISRTTLRKRMSELGIE